MNTLNHHNRVRRARGRRVVLSKVTKWWNNKQCLYDVGKAGLKGAIDPVGNTASLIGGVLNSKGLLPPVGGTVTFTNAAGEAETFKLARVGVRAAATDIAFDAATGAAVGAAIVGILDAGLELYNDKACH